MAGSVTNSTQRWTSTVILRLLLALGLLLGPAGTLSVWAKPCPMPTPADLTGAWVGEAGGAYFLLEIDADSSGVLVIEFTEGRGPSAWRVRSVSIVKRRIEFSAGAYRSKNGVGLSAQHRLSRAVVS